MKCVGVDSGVSEGVPNIFCPKTQFLCVGGENAEISGFNTFKIMKEFSQSIDQI